MKRILFLLPVLALAFTGCTHTAYQEGQAKFTRTAFFSKQSFGTLDVEAKGDGTRKLTLKNYSNEAAANASAIAEGVARGLKP